MSVFKVVALYKFVTLEDVQELSSSIREFCAAHKIMGTLLMAREGINGTLAGPAASIDSFITFLETDPQFGARFADMEIKFSASEDMPFLRLKVRVKDEIIKFEEPGISPTEIVGTYVAPREWNRLIADPGTIVVDTRNNYEVEIGTFQGAVDPKTDSFTEFKSYVANELMDKKDQPVAMFCTGGIRCEKASSYLLSLGFENVYHLKGGILKYLEEVPEPESLWQGQCFVFDERVSVGHGLEQGQYALCRACRMPISAEDQRHDLFIEGIQCHRCAETLPEKSRSRARERQHQIELAQKSGMAHLGDKATEDSQKRRAYKNFKKQRERAASKQKAS